MPPPRPDQSPPAPGNSADQLVQQAVLTATHAVRTEQWRAVLENLTVVELRGAAAEAVAAGADPAHAVTSRVRAALRALARWDEMVGELHAELAAVAGEAGLCEKTREAGLAEEARLERAWVRTGPVDPRFHSPPSAARIEGLSPRPLPLVRGGWPAETGWAAPGGTEVPAEVPTEAGPGPLPRVGEAFAARPG